MRAGGNREGDVTIALSNALAESGFPPWEGEEGGGALSKLQPEGCQVQVLGHSWAFSQDYLRP